MDYGLFQSYKNSPLRCILINNFLLLRGIGLKHEKYAYGVTEKLQTLQHDTYVFCLDDIAFKTSDAIWWLHFGIFEGLFWNCKCWPIHFTPIMVSFKLIKLPHLVENCKGYPILHYFFKFKVHWPLFTPLFFAGKAVKILSNLVRSEPFQKLASNWQVFFYFRITRFFL